MGHLTNIAVRFRDTDALGHVNNGVYASYLEEARIAFFEERMAGVASWLDVGLILAKLEINFRQPIHLGDKIWIDSIVSKIGNTSFTMQYRILKSDGTIMADAETVQVCFDYETKAPRTIPDSWRELLQTDPAKE